MVNNSFSFLVKKFFEFLVSDYGYSFREEVYSSEPFGDALIEFWSPKTIVSIMKDRLDIILLIGPFGEEEVSRLSLEVLVDFITSGEKRFSIASIESQDSVEARIEFRLNEYANILREYCDSILRGDFSRWLDALRYHINRMKEDYNLWTGLELPTDAYKSIEKYISSKEDK